MLVVAIATLGPPDTQVVRQVKGELARGVLAASTWDFNVLALKTTLNGKALYLDDAATLDDLREAVTTLEDTGRTARRVLGGAHPNVRSMEESLQQARAALRRRETSRSA